MPTFVVLGSNGGTGREIVSWLLSKPAAEVSLVRAVVRDPSTVPEDAFPDVSDGRLEILAGNVSMPETLPLHGDVRVVFFAAAGKGYASSKAVDRHGPRIVGKAAAAAGIPRVVLISSQLVDLSQGNRFSIIRGLLNTINTGIFHWKGMMDFKYEGEEYLKVSGVQSWTILRPGRLGNGPAGSSGTLAIAQNVKGSFLAGSIVNRSDLGALAVEAALSERCANKTIEVGTAITTGSNIDRPSPQFYQALFDNIL